MQHAVEFVRTCVVTGGGFYNTGEVVGLEETEASSLVERGVAIWATPHKDASGEGEVANQSASSTKTVEAPKIDKMVKNGDESVPVTRKRLRSNPQ